MRLNSRSKVRTVARHFGQTATAMACLLLSGCTLKAAAPPATYDLRTPHIMTVTAPRPAKFQLVIDEPTSVRALGSNRILVKPAPQKITYYKSAAWSDRLPSLVQVRMIQAFQNAGLVKAVGSRADRLDADLELATQLNAFQIEMENDATTAYVNLYVKAIDGQRGQMIKARGFERRVPVQGRGAPAMVAALDEAFDSTMREIVPWVSKIKR